jgi:hypothetical protein
MKFRMTCDQYTRHEADSCSRSLVNKSVIIVCTVAGRCTHIGGDVTHGISEADAGLIPGRGAPAASRRRLIRVGRWLGRADTRCLVYHRGRPGRPG